MATFGSGPARAAGTPDHGGVGVGNFAAVFYQNSDGWQAAAADPVLAPLVAERDLQFSGQTHPPEFIPPLAWHAAALREADLTEAGRVWRRGTRLVVAAL